MKSYQEVYAGKRRLPTVNDGELRSLPAKKSRQSCTIVQFKVS